MPTSTHNHAMLAPLAHSARNPPARTNTAQWKKLEAHFRHHASLVRRFRRANADLVLWMWETSRNEFGKPLSSFEREAVIERHCELFGTWPT